MKLGGMSQEVYDRIVNAIPDYIIEYGIEAPVIDLSRGVFVNHKGYLMKYIKGGAVRVHQIMAVLKYGEECVGKQVNHINGIKTDNSFDNLELMTLAENIAHGYANGLYVGNQGENSPHAKLTEDGVRFIRSSELTNAELSEILNVSRRTILGVRKGETWKHVKV